jgi:hypothetical protein
MDEFSAQSREDDDLFADEFEPVTEQATVIEQAKEPIINHSKTPDGGTASGSVASTKFTSAAAGNTPIGPSSYRNDRNHRGGRDGAGQERRRSGRGTHVQNGGLGASRYASQAELAPANLFTSSVTNAQLENASPSSLTTNNTATNPNSSDQTPQSQQTPHPTTNEPNTTITTNSGRTPAVRGDRSATGGPAHKKLTEAELTEKLEKMKILNAQKVERFRLSEADQAAFQQNEQELIKKRQEEMKNSRVMDMERAKNRERKLRAQGGREWDEGKTEADIVDRKGRSSEYVRGGYGGVIRGRGGGLAGSRYALEGEDVPDAPQSSRSRGGMEIRGRGGRGGRGGGRGGKFEAPAASASEDFPELPTPATAPRAELKGAPGEDWAEEMATPVEEKRVEL